MHNPKIDDQDANKLDSVRKEARKILEDRLVYPIGSKVVINDGEHMGKMGVITNKSSRGYIVEVDKGKSLYPIVPEKDLEIIS